ncbi:phosphoribosyltransferase [Malaciobacter molluscorum LMG 25693]|uniref:Phosphoribosyltransferase n=1 Tax=Malaciobacter molluscorum LMG 25693 TaxID=870501 RepID=A0A2G1DFA6_9BACT|nr:ComF family protein [Malaciobacter molluscorum]AXX91535.1 transformation system, predicted amidophosphoribosyltransferase CtsW [Malaciobacter molluscorum LMG 25693]PHO17171.1 phosphoribosyltransferase [Malaciobacter molluscorum LMG 25693]RXJ92769.1 phosphoribosyltransferase [Malaciobacter molluscorum]
MRCISCEKLSFYIICKNCQEKYLKPSFHKREIEENFYNYSFYALSDIEDLINSKYYFYGDKVFNILAKLSFKKFAQNFMFDEKILAIALDDHTRHDFSHTAILTKHLKSEYIETKSNILKAQSKIKYAGKDLNFRKNNPRNFKLANIHNKTTILCDDLITTGATILEGKKVLKNKNNRVLFSLTLADAKI